MAKEEAREREHQVQGDQNVQPGASTSTIGGGASGQGS